MKIAVLYGTETGNAEMLAEDIQSSLEAEHVVCCRNLADVDPAALESDALHIIVCSTYDEGQLPTSARPFAQKLESEAPDLTRLKFGIFGLGDSEYSETFAHGSLRLAELLVACGATQVGTRFLHDAAGDQLAEDVALPWVADLLQTLSA